MYPKLTFPLIAIAILQCSPLALSGAPAAASPVPAATPPAGFQLPPAPSPTPTRAPQVQGPVDIEGPVPVTPRVIPTARPTPAPTPTAAQQRPLPTILTPAPRPDPADEPRRFTPAARAVAGQAISGNDGLSGREPPTSPVDLTPAETQLGTLPSSASLPDLTDSGTSSAAPGTAASGGWIANLSPWLALAAALIAVAAGLFLMRHRRRTASAGADPIEPPMVRRKPNAADPAPAPAPEPEPEPEPAPLPISAGTSQPVSIEITPANLSRSMMNAVFSCTVRLKNSAGQDYHNLKISGDLVTAHGTIPVSEQLANADTDLPFLNTVPFLAAGSGDEIAIRITLPIGQIRTITQGRATLYVPLLRLRVTGDGLDPMTQTFVIGMQPAGSGKVQPFRLDEMPQTYRLIGSRALG